MRAWRLSDIEEGARRFSIRVSGVSLRREWNGNGPRSYSPILTSRMPKLEERRPGLPLFRADARYFLT